MGEPRFSAAHGHKFQELLKTGEVYAINLQPEGLPFGPWALGCDLHDDDQAQRLRSRFWVAVRKAAIVAGAPPRANLLDWWISRLAQNSRLGLDGLIRRSIELCEEFESASAEVGWKIQPPAAVTGLRRDQYPANFLVPYWLYDVPHDTLPDPEAEFEYWKDHVWQGFWKLLRDLEKNGVPWTDGSIHDARKCRSGETRLAFRNRIASRVSRRYEYLKSPLQCLGFDFAVLLANYVIDRRLIGLGAMRVFDEDSARLIDEMQTCWKDSSGRLGLSWRKQFKGRGDDFEIAKPFRVVRDDLALLVAAPGDRLDLGTPELGAGFGEPSVRPGPALDSKPSIPTKPVLAVGSRARGHGFKADTDRHNAIAEIVGRHCPQWNAGFKAWRRKSVLKTICEDLDHAEIDTPRGWRTGKTASLGGTKLVGWGEAFHLDYRKLIIDAIRYSLKIVLRPLAGETKVPT